MSASETVTRIAAEYSQGEDRPLTGYIGAMATFAVSTAGLGALVWRRGRAGAVENIGWSDILLTTLATQRTTRTLAKDPVTSPIRAPFTRFRGQSGEAELAEEPREGHRHVIGELVTCPFCLAQWVATGYLFGLVLAPRPTRFVMAAMTVVGGSDALQFAYDALQQKVTG